ncbi:ammonium transporter [Agarivorans sp. QJM3NY_29]|uniref:ammonium transporter n=1 Tax=unclassified Agarivorans TaxID=2636026 RepID=UPI003D7EFA54
MEYSWLLIASFLVFIMQAGFLCLETGKIRSKNSINVAAKNIADFIIASLIYWIFGFALMFGDTSYGLLGSSEFFFGDTQSPYQISFFLFQTMFCGTAATLLSGAVAERMSFIGYLSISVVLSAVIYPIAGHWAWSSAYIAGNQGWLEQIGFVDFAGSTVVHSVGGYVALAAIIIIGPRLGRFDSNQTMPVGNNLPMSVLGTLLLWLGWFGFNGGSTLIMNEHVPKIILNTCLAAVGGGLVSSLCHYRAQRFFDVGFIMNGVIAGLVSITAGCHVMSSKSAMLIGIVAGLILYFGTIWLEKLKIDDALGVVPAHLFAGIWGTLAVALFGDLQLIGTELSRSQQLFAQLVGVISIGVYSLGLSFILLLLVNRFLPLRVSAKDELQGMNVSEHRASTELIDLLNSMERQQQQGMFSTPVPVEPFTEVGQIANQYNRVIERVSAEINKRDDAINSFKASEKRKSAILDSSMDSIVTVDLSGKIIEFNPAAERTFGFLKPQVVHKNFINLFVLPKNQDEVRKSLAHRFSSSQGLLRHRRNSLTLTRNSDHEFPAEISITGANFNSNTENEFTLHIRDVTRQLKLQDKLRQLAYSDPLTGLYNRTYLMESLVQAAQRHEHQPSQVVLFFMDLDRFKKINDTLGHKAGDQLLCEVAKRLIDVTRTSDVIARWGGDEFVVLFTDSVTMELAHTKANAILSLMRQPVKLDGRVINIATSIGIAQANLTTTSAEQLIQHADIAMYYAKQRGRDNYQVFEAEMASKTARNFDYEQEMKKGLKAGEQFRIVYQPKVTADKQIVGLEALMRWSHPQEGQISPSEFIPLAEDSELVITLGEFAIAKVCQQLQAWRTAGFATVPVSVNISGRHLVSGRLEAYASHALQQHGLDGSALEFEITEGVLLTDIERCIEVMSALKKLNIQISVDDFGTGYSSLNYLKRLPIDVLKIDRSFVDECASTVEDGQICSTIINLANNLDLSTVAEGVETESQLAFLHSHGCDVYQGFYFYHPMPGEELDNLLEKNGASNNSSSKKPAHLV